MQVVAEWNGIASIKNIHEKQQLYALAEAMVQYCPQHHFTFFTDVALPFHFINCTAIMVAPVAGYISRRRWYGRRLPALLKAQKADAFFSFNGCIVPAGIPQVVFISSVTALLRASRTAPAFLYRKYLSARLAKADSIATFTQSLQQDLVKHLKMIPQQILPVGYAVPGHYQPVGWQQREQILEKNTTGREYFLYTGAFSESMFLIILKAFSLFKKRQQSSLQLVAAGSFSVSKSLQEKLDTYKYRQDVVLMPDAGAATICDLTAGAYAVVWADERAQAVYPLAAAMQCRVPGIALQNSAAAHDACAGATLYATASPESLAEQMKLLYKDENLRQQLVENAARQAQEVSKAATAAKLWKCLEDTAQKIGLPLPAS